ncbi:DUF2325 domain-containing protein [Pseudoduganella violaceinigra]|uniref:DUF2325 domain-containing protein n=1 Tax=Pseudoduganella violaceinigra TaxID=246602 RepID=UPI00040A1BD9|nr:DUF2325 domain-containing protein [Pseudoduganella violaceinigra]
MCDKHQAAAAPAAEPARRRRIWDLPHTCHCPLVGVGLPLGVLRKIVAKAVGGKVLADDYEVHVGAVSECGSRNRLSEAVQKELERRYAVVIQRFRAARDAAALEALWQAAVASGDVPGPFWAGLSHPQCSTELQERMCRDLHMIQHQAGAATRADISRLQTLEQANGALERELARLQQRSTAWQAERHAEQEQHAAAVMQLRAQLVGRDSTLASLRQQLEDLHASIPGLGTRERLARQLSTTEQRVHELRAEAAAARAEAAALERQLAEARSALAALQPSPAMPAAATAATGGPAVAAGTTPQRITLHGLLAERVLCVGGRAGNVAGYRSVIEDAGAEFLHHDGGLEDNVARLESSMAAADLVICQTACISHSAYWRVKDFCKRHQKRCIFIDNPSVTTLQREILAQA